MIRTKFCSTPTTAEQIFHEKSFKELEMNPIITNWDNFPARITPNGIHMYVQQAMRQSENEVIQLKGLPNSENSKINFHKFCSLFWWCFATDVENFLFVRIDYASTFGLWWKVQGNAGLNIKNGCSRKVSIWSKPRYNSHTTDGCKSACVNTYCIY